MARLEVLGWLLKTSPLAFDERERSGIEVLLIDKDEELEFNDKLNIGT